MKYYAFIDFYKPTTVEPRKEVHDIHFKVAPTDYSQTVSFNFGTINVSYADRGNLGGATAYTLVEDPTLEYEIIDIN